MSDNRQKLRDTLVAMAVTKFGATVTPAELIDWMRDNSSANDTTIRQHVVGAEYFRLMRETTRTSHSIEQQLGEEYGLTTDGVCYIRNNYARGGRRNRSGPRRNRS